MRSDMGKVLVERPRSGSRHLHGKSGKGYKKRVRRELVSEDGGPRREGITRMYGDLKHFGEHLGPLRRFVDANVGRPWDMVYAEISRHVDRGNVVQKHILTHLFQYVVLDVELIDGEPYRKARDRSAYRNRPLRGPHCWYVCPKTGLLRRAKAEPRRKRRQALTPGRLVAWVSASQFVLQSKGGWQLVTVRPWPEPSPWGGRNPSAAFDVLFRRAVSSWDGDRLPGFYGKKVYAVAVRTLSAGELEDLPVTLPGKLTAPNVVR